MKRIGLVVGLALAGFACADGVGEMLTDAGQMIEDAGTSMQDGSVPPTMAQEVSCNKSAVHDLSDGITYTITYRWAEFDVDPGVTEVTICNAANPGGYPVDDRSLCYRTKATWYRGTSTGMVSCGNRRIYDGEVTDTPDPVSITVHR